MPALKIETFGGEIPSVSPRALPPSAAQENRNLFLGTNEFRPLATDVEVAQAPGNTTSLYRFARGTNGELNTSTATGWVVAEKDRSYVKGQINDERTERTYFTTDDGSEPLRAITVATPNAPRLVGVPAPMKTAAVANISDELTAEEATSFMTETAVVEIQKALVSALRNPSNTVLDVGRRKLDGLPTAGPFQLWGMRWCDDPVLAGLYADKPYYAVAVIGYNFGEQMGLIGAEMDARGLPNGPGPYSLMAIPVNAGAFAYWIDATVASNNLRAIVFPETGYGAKSGQRLFTDTQVAELVARAVKWFDPANYARALRERLDAEVQAFVKLLVAAPAGANETVKAMRNRIAAAAHEVNQRSVERLKLFSDDTLWVKEWLSSRGGALAVVGPTVLRIVETRFYAATFVTDWDEESALGTPSDVLDLDQNDSATVARPELPPGETFTGRNINRWRIYRSNSGSQSAAFQFVEELNINTLSYTDTKKASALGEVCPTLTWAMPPKRDTGTNPHLRGLVGMPNGIMAGFFDNTVAFCEPYVPYAWPVEYQITTEFPIVGLGVFGQTVFVGTKGNPYFISGADSASMSSVKQDVRQACASSRSIAMMQGGVLYASPDGLCLADHNGVRVVSSGFITREDWQKLVPESMVARAHENICYIIYAGQGGGCLSFDPMSGKYGHVSLRGSAFFSDTITDSLYAVDDGKIWRVFGGTSRRDGRWKSPLITLPRQTGFVWLKVYGDQSPASPAVIRLYGDGALVHVATVVNIDPVRLPPGRWLEYEAEVESRARVTRVVVASDTTELQSV
ncbi:hypothetical protein LJR074_001980 [Acidovorax sp. LjRoot74]|uniref:hypothetical protein n=1 Tax=Acidovorax sp. LjRoot74 TaxID=3342337 RepID=UPI003ECDCE10